MKVPQHLQNFEQELTLDREEGKKVLIVGNNRLDPSKT